MANEASFLDNLGLSRNPFDPAFFTAESFPWIPPDEWEAVKLRESQVVTHKHHLDSLLTINRLLSEWDREVSSTKVPTLSVKAPLTHPLTSRGYLETIARAAGHWWSGHLVRNASPLFTMPPADAILVMRLLVWTWGSREGLDASLRRLIPPASVAVATLNVNRKDPEGESKTLPKRDLSPMTLLSEELQRKATLIGDPLQPSAQALISWLAVQPLGIEATQLILLSESRHSLTGLAEAISLICEYHPTMIIKLFKYPSETPELPALPSYSLHWKTDNLVSMADDVVKRAGDGRNFDGIISRKTILQSESLAPALAGSDLLPCLAYHANGSLARLMTYCNTILQSYRRRLQKEPTVAMDGISAADVEEAVNTLALLHATD